MEQERVPTGRRDSRGHEVYVSLVFKNLPDGMSGLYDKRSNTIVLSSNLIGSPNKKLAHEIQHVIQKIEGFAGGSSPEYWNRRIEEGYSRKLPTGEEMQPDELYRNTAGEIQARDTAARINLTADERRTTMPDLGDENTVFAEGGENYSIDEIVGKKKDYGKGVILDTNIFDNVHPRDWAKVLKEHVYKNMAGTELTMYDEEGNPETVYLARDNDRVKKDGANSSHRVIDKLARYNGDNIRALATVHLSESLEVSKHKNTTDEHSHQWMDENGWEHRTVYLQDKTGDIYKATLNIADGRDRRILYDINNIRKIDKNRGTAGGAVPSTVSGGARSTSHSSSDALSLPEKQSDVKGYFDENGKIVLPKYEAEAERSAPPSEQTKDIANENPTRNKGIRFSAEDVPETEKAPAKKKKEVKPVAKSLPIIAKKELRETMMSIFSIPPGYKKMLGDVVDRLADKLLETGTLSWEERKKFFDGMYESGVMTVAADEYSNYARDIVLKKKIYVPEEIRHEFGGSEDYNEFKKRAFAAGIYLTGNSERGDKHGGTPSRKLAEYYHSIVEG